MYIIYTRTLCVSLSHTHTPWTIAEHTQPCWAWLHTRLWFRPHTRLPLARHLSSHAPIYTYLIILQYMWNIPAHMWYILWAVSPASSVRGTCMYTCYHFDIAYHLYKQTYLGMTYFIGNLVQHPASHAHICIHNLFLIITCYMYTFTYMCANQNMMCITFVPALGV